jgi:hypothetical protein
MLKRAFYICALVAGLAGLGTSSARAITVVDTVDAFGNSSSGGIGLLTGVSLTFGQAFSVSAGANDLWSAGALPRWSNADGLTGIRLANASDDSGQVPGTIIGTDSARLSEVWWAKSEDQESSSSLALIFRAWRTLADSWRFITGTQTTAITRDRSLRPSPPLRSQVRSLAQAYPVL